MAHNRPAPIGLVLALTIAVALPAVGTETVYDSKAPSSGGIGKVYMGREISHVMGHLGARWLERDSRENEERTDLFIERLPVEPGDVVADIGAGTGYFALPIAERVESGQVLAVDIQPEMLAVIERRVAERSIGNVRTIEGSVTDPGLPDAGVDLVYIVDAYHEFSYPREMGEAIVRALVPGGKLVLVEYRKEDPDVPIKPLHKMSERQAVAEMEALGLRFVENQRYLPQQHVLIFEKAH